MEVLEYCIFLVLLSHSFHAVVVRAQIGDKSGFISLDCGAPKNSSYIDLATGIEYSSDAGFIDTGVPSGDAGRSFPQGIRNCYTLTPNNSNQYLIRTIFDYGNYDGKSRLPQFDLYFGVDYWDTIKFSTITLKVQKEIILNLRLGFIHVCLVNTGHGTPFITTLELRPLDTTASALQSDRIVLDLFGRWNFGDDKSYRFPNDVYDRIWQAAVSDDQINISTKSVVNTRNEYNSPSAVMSTAVIPRNSSKPLTFWWPVENSTAVQFYTFLYYAEIEQLQPNQSRTFNIYVDGYRLREYFRPNYLAADTFYLVNFPPSHPRFEISMNKYENSTLPPVINALEVYKGFRFSLLQTDDQDTNAVFSIKSVYGIKRIWQGDPCGPPNYAWDGLKCSYGNGYSPPRIISLNLSSSGLHGSITPLVLNLEMLQTLDLSNNKLTGQVPDFLADHPSLKILNLEGNCFTGPIPLRLLVKSQRGLLSLSTNDLDNVADTCKNSTREKKTKVIVPVLASVGTLFFLLTSLAVIWTIRRKKIRGSRKNSDHIDFTLEAKKRRFTYPEILKITNNFQQVIGRGSFGIVYRGSINNTEVAVKMFSSSLDQGLKELQSEANVLMNVHHRNLTSLVGYCIDRPHVGIIYEYMANGDLKARLLDKNLRVLSWEERLQISIDAAQGLEYMHHGCKPPIVHRDVKSTNILLNEKFEAKIADFGLCRTFPTGTVSHVSTNHIAGTRGYLDPEYCNTFRLTERSDVYSFGVVLLEIITSRPAIIVSEPVSLHISQWVSSCMREGEVKDIVDPRLMAREYDVNSVRKAVEIAMACLSYDSTTRPTMSQVVIELKECLSIEMTR